MKKLLLLLFVFSLLYKGSKAQILKDFDVSAENFEYKIKNIETFIYRFNNQVDRKGNPISNTLEPDDPEYKKERRNELVTVFDYNFLSECGLPEQKTIKKFVNKVVEENILMDFYGDEWFAEIKYKTLFKGREEELIFVLFNYSPGNKASGWTINSFFFKPLDLKYFSEKPSIILPPNSDGTMFINLKQTLQDSDEMAGFMNREDSLSKLLALIKENKIILEHIEDIRFHFWQVKPFHIIVDYFNRNEANAGWLISGIEEEE